MTPPDNAEDIMSVLIVVAATLFGLGMKWALSVLDEANGTEVSTCPSEQLAAAPAHLAQGEGQADAQGRDSAGEAVVGDSR